jgi:hypothetical protein
MGYYINTGASKNKADYLIHKESGIELMYTPKSLLDIPPDRGLVCVVDNKTFEAAAFVYDEDELKAFTLPGDYREKWWIHIPLERAKALSGYNG